jgi:S-adenosylmethionine decarboxylase
MSSLDGLYAFLDRLVDVIEMERLAPPRLIRHLASSDPEWGITGGVYISTSHIQIHTYPERNIAFLDIFSCKPFDEGKALGFIREMLCPTGSLETQTLQRGRHFHKD